MLQLNEKINSNANKNYTYGFKSSAVMRKISNLSLGDDFYHKRLETDAIECAKSCLRDSKCIGVTVDKAIYYILHLYECFFYNVSQLFRSDISGIFDALKVITY